MNPARAAALRAVVAECLEDRRLFSTVLGLTAGNTLIRFDSATPNNVATIGPITGLQAGEQVLGMDFRPTTGDLVGLGSTGRLYVIDPATAAATERAVLSSALAGTTFGVDFNPVPDLAGQPSFRVISDADQNLRVNANTGVVSTDTPIAAGLNIVASAYTNVDTDLATGTTLFGIDSLADSLLISTNPNGGTYNTVGTNLGIGDVTSDVGFDVLTSGAVNTAFAALSANGTSSSFYTIDLTTGTATLVGQIGAGPTLVRGLSVVPEFTPAATLYGINGANLLRFSAANPSVVISSAAITGDIQGGETILGIDFRPTTGELFGLGSNNRLYTINPTTAVATLRAALTAAPGDDNPFAGLAGTSFGVGFNPVPDLAGNPSLRVISDAGQNLRINVNPGASVGQVTTDTTINPAGRLIGGSAYTNVDLDPATGTTLFGIDLDATDTLVTTANANGGTYAIVGPLGLPSDAVGQLGFDIQTLPGGTNQAFATLSTNGTSSNLYSINLTTGAATQIGTTPIGGAAPLFVSGLAIAPAGTFQFSAPTYTVGESGPTASITINRIGGSEGLATVQFSTTDGTANAPGDYGDSDQTVIFGPGVSSVVVQVPIVNDGSAEVDETINLALSNPTGGAQLGAAAQAAAVLTIADDDSTDVAVTKSDSPDPVLAGNNITYTITVTPGVSQEAQNVILTDAIPANTTFVSLTAPAGWNATAPAVGATGTVTAARPTLSNGDGPQVFTLVVNVNATAPDGGTITNTATVSADNDVTPANNSDTETTAVTGFVVTNTNDSGPGSLRQVILNSNAAPGTQTIRFNIAGPGPHVIAPATQLPIVATAIIDGRSEPDFDAATGAPAVVLDGVMAGAGAIGLFLFASNSTEVHGLEIIRFTTGVHVSGGADVVITGNYIGTDGTTGFGNGLGIVIENPNARRGRIGGTSVAERNVISGNGTGIRIGNGASFSLVQGNYIGTNAAGTAAIGNLTGIELGEESFNNIVGGTDPAMGNLISGNTNTGILVFGSSQNLIQGNRIGTDASGAGPVGNATHGIHLLERPGVIIGNPTIPTQRNVIGGSNPSAGNIIAFNGGAGVLATTPLATANAVRLNSIHSNGGLGIDLKDDGLTFNDPNDFDTGPNGLQNFPALTSAVSTTSGGGATTIQGSINTNPNTNYFIDFYTNTATEPSGIIEGRTYVGTTQVTTDASGNATFNTTIPISVPNGVLLTATATSTTALPAGDTSEFAPPVLVQGPTSPPPPPPAGRTISVNDVSTTEGNSGTKNITFTVKLSSAAASNVSVKFSTAQDSATKDVDYVHKTGTLTFTPGQTTRTVTVQVKGDTAVEGNERFKLNLFTATGPASIGDGTGFGTIVNDDGAVVVKPKISVAGVSLTEGNSGTKQFQFKVTLDKASTSPVTVKYKTSNGTASAGGDYTALSLSTLTFAANETTKFVTVLVKGDTAAEANETFFLNLSAPTNATIAVGKGTGTIRNDD